MRRIWSFSSVISFLQRLFNSTWYHFFPLLSLRSMSSSAIPPQGPRLQVLSSQVSSQPPSIYFISESGRQQDTAAIARSLNLKLEMKVSFTEGKKNIIEVASNSKPVRHWEFEWLNPYHLFITNWPTLWDKKQASDSHFWIYNNTWKCYPNAAAEGMFSSLKFPYGSLPS